MNDQIIPYLETLEAFAKENKIALTRACYRAELHPSTLSRPLRGVGHISYPIARKLMDAMHKMKLEKGGDNEAI